MAGDWNGDGTATAGVYNPATGEFRLTNSITGSPADQALKIKGLKKVFVPVSADWNNDGRWSPGLYDPAKKTFYWRNSLGTGPSEGSTTVIGVKPVYLPVTGVSDASGAGPSISNHSPVFDSHCPATATVNAAFSCTAHATDPDSDPLSYGLSGAPAGMTINPSTGAINCAFNWTPNAGGNISFTITVSDDRGGSASQPVIVAVAVVYDGGWSGTTSQSFPVSFTVVGNEIMESSIRTNRCGVTFTETFSVSPRSLATIVNGGFSFSRSTDNGFGFQRQEEYSGLFTSGSTISGTLVMNPNEDPFCTVRRQVINWTANRI